eukprot:scaffold231205_cov22-Tisochrysis_lutea.AAC.1
MQGGYFVWIPSLRRITTARDVDFRETTFTSYSSGLADSREPRPPLAALSLPSRRLSSQEREPPPPLPARPVGPATLTQPACSADSPSGPSASVRLVSAPRPVAPGRAVG